MKGVGIRQTQSIDASAILNVGVLSAVQPLPQLGALLQLGEVVTHLVQSAGLESTVLPALELTQYFLLF